MKTRKFPRSGLIAVAGMLLGTLPAVGAGIVATPALYQGKDAKDAAAALLQVAEQMAGDGSWELIAVGRVYYLSGDKEKGESLLNRAISKKAEKSDYRRIAAIYTDAKDYDKAISTLEKALAKSPKDSTLFAELGAAYNMKGDRAKAEEMFAKSFANEPDSIWNTVNVAGSYRGVSPD